MIRDDLAAAWLTLATSCGSDDGLELLPLEVKSPDGAVCAGRDMMGNVHLLVPVPPASRVGPDHRSQAVDIDQRELIVSGNRQLFVDLACRARALDDVFERLALEVCEQVGATPQNAPTIPGRVLARWRQLLETRLNALGPGPTTGLFGELHVLEQTVATDPARRVDHWQHATRAVHDLRRGSVAIEVKTTTAREGRVVEVHGINQLEPPEGGSLYLVFLRIENTPNGLAVDDMVDQLLDHQIDEKHLAEVLAETGWERGDPTAPRFTLTEERWYRVDAAFPKIVPLTFLEEGLPDGVSRLRYSVDLAGARPRPISVQEKRQVLDDLAGA